MGRIKKIANDGELVEDDALEGDQLAALLIWINRTFPPLLRVNPACVLPADRPAIIAWATEAVRRGERLAVKRATEIDGPGVP